MNRELIFRLMAALFSCWLLDGAASTVLIGVCFVRVAIFLVVAAAAVVVVDVVVVFFPVVNFNYSPVELS